MSPLSPHDLVARLRQGNPAARKELVAWLNKPLAVLIELLLQNGEVRGSMDQLLEHTLSCVELALCSGQVRADGDRDIFIARVVLWLSSAHATAGRGPFGPPSPLPLPPPDAFPGYAIEPFCQPMEEVGGDRLLWDCRDGIGWLMICDVTGHGWAAHILAEALPALWAELPGPGSSSSARQVLLWLNSHLVDRLPPGVFVEAVVMRLGASGQIGIAAAGRVCVYRIPASQLTLGGHLLGLVNEPDFEETTWELGLEEDYLLASDGLFEQPLQPTGPHPQLGTVLLERIGAQRQPGESLLSAVLRILDQARKDSGSRHDDVTIVAVRRQA